MSLAAVARQPDRQTSRPNMERGRDGIDRSVKTHITFNGKNAGFTAGEIERRYFERQALRPLTVKCALNGCDWPGYSGTTADAIQAAKDHRHHAHPDLKPVKRLRTKLQAQTDARANAAIAATEARRARFDTGLPLDEDVAA